MTTTSLQPAAESLDSPAGLLAAVREDRAIADAAEARLLAHVVAWAAMHPAESVDDAASVVVAGMEDELSIAGPGAPLVAEFCVAELAAALNLSPDSGRLLLGEAVELRHRLPKTWARVVTGDLVAWKARRIAKQTIGLPQAGAAFVDQHVAPAAHKIGTRALDRLIAEAETRFDPEAAEAKRREGLERRCFEVETDQVSYDGTVRIYGELDAADAFDLDQALAQRAGQFAALGSTESLDARRAMAAGDLARHQLALDLTTDLDTGTDVSDAELTRPARRVKPRQVVLHVHLSHAAVTGSDKPDGIDLARVEELRGFVSADQVRTWCATPDAQIIVKPVIDLAGATRTEAYEIPDRLRDQVILRDGSCVFPWCTRPARGCDLDHITSWGQTGDTSPPNLAPLCRRHHRLKTHSRWRYDHVEPGVFYWTSPHGYQFRRDPTGTTDA